MRRLWLILAVLALTGLAGAPAAYADPLPDLGDLIRDLGGDQTTPDDDLDVGEEMCALPG